MADRAKRERKSTDHFVPGPEPKEAKKTVAEEGKGTKLGEIPNVAFKLNNLKSSDDLLESLHTLLYKSKGKTTTRKREVKSFSGFVFSDGEEDTELEKLTVRLNKWTLVQLHAVMDLFDIPRGSGEDGTKEKKIDRIAEFLLEPKVLSDKDLAAKKAEKKEKAARAKERASAKKPAAKKPAAKKAADKKPAAEKKPAAADASKSRSTPAKTAKSPPAAAAAEKPAAGRKRKATEEAETPAKKAKKTGAGEGKAAAEWPSDDAVASDIQAFMQKAEADSKALTQRDIYTQLGEKYGMSVGEIKKKKEEIKKVCQSYKVEQPQNNGQQEEEAPAAGSDEPEKTEAATGNEDEAAPMDVEAAAKDGSKPAEADIEEGNAEDEKRDSPAEKESEQPAEEAVASHATVMESSQLEPQPEEKPANTTAEKDEQLVATGPSQPQLPETPEDELMASQPPLP